MVPRLSTALKLLRPAPPCFFGCLRCIDDGGRVWSPTKGRKDAGGDVQTMELSVAALPLLSLLQSAVYWLFRFGWFECFLCNFVLVLSRTEILR